jgi:hypothetical protein
VVSNLVTSDEPVGDEGEISVRNLSKVGHLGLASIRVLALSKELVDRVDGIGLDRIVCGEHNELRHFALKRASDGSAGGARI